MAAVNNYQFYFRTKPLSRQWKEESHVLFCADKSIGCIARQWIIYKPLKTSKGVFQITAEKMEEEDGSRKKILFKVKALKLNDQAGLEDFLFSKEFTVEEIDFIFRKYFA